MRNGSENTMRLTETDKVLDRVCFIDWHCDLQERRIIYTNEPQIEADAL